MIKWLLWMLPILSTVAFGQVAHQPTVAFSYSHQVDTLSLCQYDWVIVDPYSNFNPRHYCYKISQPLAYVSMGEAAQDAPYIKDIKKTWVIGKNVAWNNNVVLDQTNKEWQTYFLEKRIDALWAQGYQGFFLDTLDSYFLASKDPQKQAEQIQGMVYLIHQIKARHPQAKIILNRGFQLLPSVHDAVSAVVIESLYHAWNQAKRIYEKTAPGETAMLWQQINAIRKMNLPIIIIDYLPPSEKNKAQALSEALRKQGFIPWITDSSLQALYLYHPLNTLPRHILMVFRYQGTSPIEWVARFGRVDIILEYMGYILKYINAEDEKALPLGDLRPYYAGIIIFSNEASAKNMPLFEWAKKQIQTKIPVVFINSFGIPIDHKALSFLKIATEGLVAGNPMSGENGQTKLMHITRMNPQYVGYEMKPTASPYDFYPVKAPSGNVLLQFKNDADQTEDAVAITPWGGYVLLPYYIQYLPNTQGKWIINPFTFFRDALRLKDFPIPDTTTENGRRLMSVHIDGDGFSLKSKWIGGGYAAEELYNRILMRFRIPTSVSVITGEIAPNGSNPKISASLMAIARRIFALPWVESASHSFSHPFDWRQHDNSNEMIQGESYTLKIPNYQFNLSNLSTEITGSVDFINQYLLPPDKKCGLFFWSGKGDPDETALGLASSGNVLNINGIPDTYLTYKEPSLTGVQPMGIEIGAHIQTFSPIDGDFYYINGLLGPLYGYKKVIQTLVLTDKPRRLKPIDLYYHIYSAGYIATLEALITVYEWALNQSVMNIFISDYIKKVIDYFHIQIVLQDDGWLIKSDGNLRELRIEHGGFYPDLMKSQNVIGFRAINGALYIHLGPNPFTILKYQQQKPDMPYLVEANGKITAYSRTPRHLMLKMQAYTPLQFTLDNVATCQVSSINPLHITQNTDGTVYYQSEKDSDEIHISC